MIDVEEAKAHLEDYARECQSSPVVVTVGGTPMFEMLPIRQDDDFIDVLLEKSEPFRRLVEERWQKAKTGDVSSLEEVRKRLSSLGQQSG